MAAEASRDTPEQTSPAQPEPDAPLLGFLVIGAILYFAIVWRSLHSDSTRWIVTAAIAALVTAVWVLAAKLPAVRRGLSSQGAKLAGDGARRRHCLLYTSPSPRDRTRSRMPSSA